MQPQSETAQGVGNELLSDAKSVGNSVANRLYSEADARKGDAVSQVGAVSSAIDKTVDNLDDSAPTWLKSALEQGAQQIHKLSASLEQKDSRELIADVGNFARQSPGTFLAICGALGFAAARVFKAGSPDATAASYGNGYIPQMDDDIGIETYPVDDAGINTSQSAGFATNGIEGERI